MGNSTYVVAINAWVSQDEDERADQGASRTSLRLSEDDILRIDLLHTLIAVDRPP